MGGSMSHDKSYGSIYVQTARSTYTAGEQVDGFVHLNLSRDFPAPVLHLIVHGEEDVKLVSTSTRTDADNNTHTEVHVHRDKHEFYGHTFPLYSAAGSYFLRGQYSFPFSFRLLDTLPGTFRKHWHEHGHDCHAHVSYRLWAGLKHPKHNSAVFDELQLRVEQRFTESQTNQTRSFHKRIQAYCYRDVGEFGLQCVFQHDSYRVNDVANMLVSVDCGKAKVAVRGVQCILWQDTHVKTVCGSHSKTMSVVVSQSALPGVPAGEARTGESAMPLQLPVRTASDQEATCSGRMILNSFRLEVRAELDACLCYDSAPSNQMSIKIYNKDSCVAPMMPLQQNWAPQVMVPYVCTMTPEYRMTKEFKNNLVLTNDAQYPTL